MIPLYLLIAGVGSTQGSASSTDNALHSKALVSEARSDVAIPAMTAGSSLKEPTTPDEFLTRGYDRLNIQSRYYARSDFDRSRALVEDALADFDRAAALDATSSIAQSLRALALIELARLDEAEGAIAKALHSDKVDPRVFQVRGLLYARRGQPEKAIPDFTRYLLEANPTSMKTFLERALAYEGTGQLEMARADLQRAGQFGLNMQINLILARVTARLGNIEQATAIIDQTLSHGTPQSTATWRKTLISTITRGRIFEMAGRAKEARDQYEAALNEIIARQNELTARPSSLAGETIGLLTSKAFLFVQLGQPKEAIAVADKALKEQPDNALLLIERCRAELRAGRTISAREDCDAALRNDHASLEALYLSGLVSLKLHDWDRAANEFQALVGKRWVPALFGRGVAKIGRGDRSGGGADIEAARSLSPNIDFDFDEFGINPSTTKA